MSLLTAPDGRLQAQRFNPRDGTLVGETVDLSDSVATGLDPAAVAAAISEDGLIAFIASFSAPTSELYWFSRDGKRLSQPLQPGPGVGLDLSRDARLGVNSVAGTLNPGVFVLDLSRGLRSRLTTSPAGDSVISPEGRRVAYVVQRRRLDVQAALGGDPHTVFTAPTGQTLSLEHWSDDGKYLIAMTNVGDDRQVLRLPIEGQEKPMILASNLKLIDETRLSPDGRWLAFNAALSDRNEVYVSPVPPTGERIQISTAGGTSARWREDGGELYYLAPDGTLMAVKMAVRDGRPDPSVPVPLFKTGITPSYNLDHYAVGPGAKTFLLRLPAATTEGLVATLLVNWLP
ncbi:MAG: hypothetical protein Q7R30_09405 [Acidobacteriota bacterium]|nr:hypothetical protein [Acidobacteriota bacterium]